MSAVCGCPVSRRMKACDTLDKGLPTPSTIEVAHFRYFVSERRVPFPQIVGMKNLDFEKNTFFCRLGPWDHSPRLGSLAAMRGIYGAPEVRSLREYVVHLYFRTPLPVSAACPFQFELCCYVRPGVLMRNTRTSKTWVQKRVPPSCTVF